MFIYDKVAPNGANTKYHKAVKFEIHAEAIHAVVNSYHAETMEMISWQDTYGITIEADIIKSIEDVEFVLANHPSSPFYGATIVPDETATLDSKKARKWADVKIRRDWIMADGVTTSYGVFDADDQARANISGASLAAVIAKGAGQPFEVTWTLKDNTSVTLNADQMIEVGLITMAFVDATHGRARELRTEIDAAIDEEALSAIDITLNWPSQSQNEPEPTPTPTEPENAPETP